MYEIVFNDAFKLTMFLIINLFIRSKQNEAK